MTIPPEHSHSIIVSRLCRLIANYQAKAADEGMLYVPCAGIMGRSNTWLEPDLFYVAAETNSRLDPAYPDYRTTADLVIEVISPTSAIYDRNTKADTYAAIGVKELWLVDESSEIIEVRVLKDDRYAPSVAFERGDELKSTVLPDLRLKVDSVFGD